MKNWIYNVKICNVESYRYCKNMKNWICNVKYEKFNLQCKISKIWICNVKLAKFESAM